MKYLYTLFITLLSLGISNAQNTYSANPVFDGIFAGALYSQTFEFPTGADAWAGFANNNSNAYPISFPNGGKITFKASATADTSVRFHFEKNPYPDTEPSYSAPTTAITAAAGEYTIDVPAGVNPYNSTIL